MDTRTSGACSVGSTFTKDKYDRERYEAMRTLASRMMAMHTGVPATQIEALFEGKIGNASPKVDMRRAVFDLQGRILKVREIPDSGRWTLPGGRADVDLTVTENVVKEVREESGFDVRVRKLAAVYSSDGCRVTLRLIKALLRAFSTK